MSTHRSLKSIAIIFVVTILAATTLGVVAYTKYSSGKSLAQTTDANSKPQATEQATNTPSSLPSSTATPEPIPGLTPTPQVTVTLLGGYDWNASINSYMTYVCSVTINSPTFNSNCNVLATELTKDNVTIPLVNVDTDGVTHTRLLTTSDLLVIYGFTPSYTVSDVGNGQFTFTCHCTSFPDYAEVADALAEHFNSWLGSNT